MPRIAAENCLWGASRIRGDLLKLGIAISDRTVSRAIRTSADESGTSLADILRDHVARHTVVSPVMFANAGCGKQEVSVAGELT